MHLTHTYIHFCAILLGGSLICASAAGGQSGKRIVGRVVDGSGTFVQQGVTVTLFSEERVQVAKVDGDGRFEFVDIAPGSYGLEATSRGFNTARVESIQIVDKDIEGISILLTPGTGNGAPYYCFLPMPLKVMQGVSYEMRSDSTNLTGTVSDYSGVPLPDATVYLLKPNGTRVTTTSNEKGEFRFADLEPGKYEMAAVHDGYHETSQRLHIARQNLTRLIVAMLREVPCNSPGAMPSEIEVTHAPDRK
jgi:hypothetical protein